MLPAGGIPASGGLRLTHHPPSIKKHQKAHLSGDDPRSRARASDRQTPPPACDAVPLLSTAIVGANYVDTPAMVILFMAIAFFGSGVSSITWVLVSSMAKKEEVARPA
jgi:hypothetical protein